MKLYICKEEKVIYEEEITEEYRRNLIRLMEKGEDIQISMIPEIDKVMSKKNDPTHWTKQQWMDFYNAVKPFMEK